MNNKFWLLYLQSLFIFVISIDFKPSLKTLSINSTGLSITSFKYNSKSTVSNYIDRIFGSKAFHLHREVFEESKQNEQELYNNNVEQKLFNNYFDNGIKNIRNYINLTSRDEWPFCSFEILGYTILELDNPFKNDYKNIGPSIGNASITTNDPNINYISCYYRGLYENWITDDWKTKPNYFPTFFYCPIKNERFCNILNYKEYIDITITMKLQRIELQNKFSGRIANPFSIVNIDEFNKQPTIGVCVALSHLSSDQDKVDANGAILYEWIRYNLKLGFKVFVYDRDGGHYNSTFNSRYSKLRHIDDVDKEHLVYHNYTIRGLLHPESKGLRYDNTEGESDNVVLKMFREGSKEKDKQYTLTQCRFEAMATYNIHNVIVSDSDEFLYCSHIPNKAIKQSIYIRNMINYYNNLKIDQITFKQRILANKTDSIRNCLINNAINGISIFECIGSYKFKAGYHLIKSLHIGLKCPFTGYHSSCSYDYHALSHDCLCTNINMDFDCAFVHLSSNPRTYRLDYNDKQREIIRSSHNEIDFILNSTSYNHLNNTRFSR